MSDLWSSIDGQQLYCPEPGCGDPLRSDGECTTCGKAATMGVTAAGYLRRLCPICHTDKLRLIGDCPDCCKAGEATLQC